MAKAFVHASRVYTGEGIRKKDGRKVTDDDLGVIEDGAVVFEPGKKILWVGKTEDLPKKFKSAKKTDLKNKKCVVPGFVDCHTHLVFAGDRAEEFALRCGGMSYEEIARRGGGIVRTVEATRQVSEKDLLSLAVARVKQMADFGVRTIEIKSGYGLSVDAELKSLKVAQTLKKKFPELTFQVTFLGAHAFPKDQAREAYLDSVINTMLPKVARAKLADACDVFVDAGYFTNAEGRRILSAAQALGLKIKIHADELGNTESAALAAELGCLSADHLLKISDSGISALAASDTVGVLLPGTAFYLKAPYAPARKILEAGACVAISTDYNPGTCPIPSLPFMMALSALYMGMTRAEIFAAVTYNAAKALGLQGRKGTLEAGRDADVVALPCDRFERLYYAPV
jgi:imidazolonepropionase